MAALLRSGLIGMAGLVITASAALADQHCPANPGSTYSFFQNGASYDDEKPRVEALAGPAARMGGACILAFYDSTYAKLLAFRRAKWVEDALIDKGANPRLISIELRPLADADKDNKGLSHLVQIILGP